MLKTVVINLDRSSDRLAEFAARYPLAYERVRAVDAVYGEAGYANDYQFNTKMERVPRVINHNERVFINNPNMRRNTTPLMPGEIGCALSHRYIYEQVYIHNLDAVMVLEDDSVPVVSMVELATYLSNLPAEFDLIYLGTSHWFPTEQTTSVNDYYSRITRRFFNGTYAYIISNACARKLLILLSNSLNLPADDTLSNAFVDGCIDVIVPKQPLFGIDDTVASTLAF